MRRSVGGALVPRLEWIIIVLIMIEVLFQIAQLLYEGVADLYHS